MQQPTKRTPKQSPSVYAFIDSQNLNLGVQRMGWKLDWRRFRKYLSDKHGVTHAYMFIGYMSENESMYEYMHELGYLVVLKPTVDVKAPQQMVPGELYVGWACKNRSCGLVIALASTAPSGKAVTEFDDQLTAIKCPHCGDEDLYRWSARSEHKYAPKSVPT